MNTIKISIATDYSETPAGRYVTDGPYSGERFRNEILLPALKENESVEVDLDGTLGYGSSFLEEAFGGLIRECGLSLEFINQRLKIKSSRVLYTRRIKQYLLDASTVSKKEQF